MILGIGVDLVCTRRIQALIAKYGNKFTNRIFSEKKYWIL
ncbi:putative holo-(acyl-carrier-protein) synthase [Anaplasma phagocytophilum str. ApNYW]|nr:putative holo-(acyl-carrier-protein) synthase [Anaplasma phagocytophilum str. ApNYW]